MRELARDAWRTARGINGRRRMGGILIEVELAVAGLVPRAGVVVKPLQDRHQQLEVLEAVQILLLEFGFTLQ